MVAVGPLAATEEQGEKREKRIEDNSDGGASVTRGRKKGTSEEREDIYRMKRGDMTGSGELAV